MRAADRRAGKKVEMALLIFEWQMQPALGGLRPGIGANGSWLATFALQDSIKLLAGAVAGGVLGYLFSRARACSAEACHARTNGVLSVVGWAVFAAALVWYFLRR